MTYPDGEVVSYRYNLGGRLSSVSGRKDYTYDYVEEIGYDEYEQKKYMKYGNGVETTYDYSTKRRRLGTLVVSNQKGNIMDNTYSYDQLDNITKLENKGMAQHTKDSKTIGGGVSHNYTYDAWNRLVEAHGTFSGADDKSAKYDLFMAYDELYNVTSKKLDVEQTNLQFPGTLKAGHALKYQYDRENNDPFRLLSVSASEYRVAVEEGENPEAPVEDDKIVNTRSEYAFDANGNQTQVATGKEAKEGVEELPQANLRQLLWDEENRLLAINDNGHVSNYFYDANGERTVKMSAGMEELYINGARKGDKKTFDAKFVAYVSPYLVLKNGGEYTKHIYAGTERVASKIGDFGSFGADPRRVEMAGAGIREINYGGKYSALNSQIDNRYKEFDVTNNLEKNEDWKDNSSFCCNGNGEMPTLDGDGGQASSMGDTTKPEVNIFFYHPDHLGSTALVTDADGEVTQHVAYIPYGEVFIEERNGVWNTPYLFNAKELDEETGLYYYGARYLNPKDTRWLSVDPLFEKYMGMTPYNYCAGSPVKLVDEDGMGPKERVEAAKGMSGIAYKPETTKELRTGDSEEALKYMDCSEFVCRVMAADNLTDRVLWKRAQDLETYFEEQNYEKSDTPKEGDFALWEGHVGVVTGVDKDNKFKLTHARGKGKLSGENSYYITAEQYTSSKFIGFFRPKEESDSKSNDVQSNVPGVIGPNASNGSSNTIAPPTMTVTPPENTCPADNTRVKSVIIEH